MTPHTDAITAEGLAELTARYVQAIDEDEEAALGLCENLGDELRTLFELGLAAGVVAKATELLDAPGEADILHEVVRGLVEVDGDDEMTATLVVLPVALSWHGAAASTSRVADESFCSDVETLAAELFGLDVGSRFAFAPYFYCPSELSTLDCDKLYDLMPAVQRAGALSPTERRRRLGQTGGMKVNPGLGAVRYLVGVMSTTAIDQSRFEHPHLECAGRERFAQGVGDSVERALGTGWKSVAVFGIESFFRGLVTGESYAREACFRGSVLAGLGAAMVSPRATRAHFTVPVDRQPRIEVRLLGMDNISVATAHWDLVEPTDPDGEFDKLVRALEQLGVRTGPDASVMRVYGTA